MIEDSKLKQLGGNCSEWLERARKAEKSKADKKESVRYCLQRAYFDSDDPAEAFFRFTRDIVGRKGVETDERKHFHPFMTKPRRFKMLQAARGSWKSSICVADYAAWSIGCDVIQNGESRIRILMASEVEQLAKRNMRWVIRILRSRNYMYLAGNHKASGNREGYPWGVQEVTSAYRQDARISDPTLMPMGSGSDRTGFHFDKIICDDLEAERSSASRDMIENCWEFYRLLHSILDPQGEMDVICTRWHDDDIYARIEEENKHTESIDEQFDILTIPACDEHFQNLNFPDILNEKKLRDLKRKQGSYIFSCTPAETPILMADWTERQIKDVRIGDFVVGFDRRPCKSTVLATGQRRATVYTLKMESGRTVRCTEDHYWYVGEGDRYEPDYKRYMLSRVGRDLKFVRGTEESDKDSWLCEDKIESMTLDGVEMVYSMQTTTGNYIAWGYASRNCQYILNPVPETERIFKAEWVKTIQPMMLKQRMNIYVTADFAWTEIKKSDFRSGRGKAAYTVILTVAIDEAWNYIVLDWFRDQCSTHTSITELYRQWKQNGAKNAIVQKYDVRGIDETIEQVGYELSENMPIEYVAYPMSETGKVARIENLVQPRFKDLKVYLHPTMVKWFVNEEMLDFPHAKYLDCLDALCNVIRWGKPPAKSFAKRAMNKEQREIAMLKAGVDPEDKGDVIHVP